MTRIAAGFDAMRGVSQLTYRPEIWFMQQAYGLIVPRVVGRISDLMPDGTEVIGIHLCATADDRLKNVDCAASFFLTSDPELPAVDIADAEPIIEFKRERPRNMVRVYGAEYVVMWPMRKLLVGSKKRLGIALHFFGTDPMTIHGGILYRER